MINKIQNLLQSGSFFDYISETPEIREKYLREYKKVSAPSNKRNLVINKTWESVNSFGPKRKIITVDLGGTNLNIFDISVTGAKKIKINKKHSCGFYKDKVYTPKILFEDLRKEMDHLLSSPSERKSLKNIVFIFSYPIEQLIAKDGNIDAVCTKMVKEHKTKGIVGTQIGTGFRDHLRKNGYPSVSVAVTNDTPINLFSAKAFEILNGVKHDSIINLIVGTGCNVATAHKENPKLRIINTEFGDFPGASLSVFDKEYDKKSTNKNSYLNEKMISGAYQHEIFKIIVNGLINKKIIGRELIKGLNLPKLDSGGVEKLLNGKLTDKAKYEPLRYVWEEIGRRGGTLCGIFMAGLMIELHKQSKKQKTKALVMQTGSVVSKPGSFRETLFDTIDKELKRLGYAGKISWSFRELPNQAAYGAVVFDEFSAPAK